jgi:hypothetical protein
VDVQGIAIIGEKLWRQKDATGEYCEEHTYAIGYCRRRIRDFYFWDNLFA